MAENIYQPPSSNLDVKSTVKGSPAKAITIGLLVSVVGTLIFSVVLTIVFAMYWTTQGITPEQVEALTQTDPALLAAFLLISGVFSIWSGYYVARKTNDREYVHSAILIAVGMLLGVGLWLLLPESYEEQPDWYVYSSYLLYPFEVLLGCWLKLRKDA